MVSISYDFHGCLKPHLGTAVNSAITQLTTRTNARGLNSDLSASIRWLTKLLEQGYVITSSSAPNFPMLSRSNAHMLRLMAAAHLQHVNRGPFRKDTLEDFHLFCCGTVDSTHTQQLCLPG